MSIDPRDPEVSEQSEAGAAGIGSGIGETVVTDTVVTESVVTEVATEPVLTETVVTEAVAAESVVAEPVVAETPFGAPIPNAEPGAPTVVLPHAAQGEVPGVFPGAPYGGDPNAYPHAYPAAFPGAVPDAPKPRRKGVFVAAWLGSALAVGALTGGGILAATGTSKSAPAAAPVAAPSSSAAPVESGVRSDGTHYGPLTAFLLPMPSGFEPGPDESIFGNDSAVTPDQLDAEMTEIFGKLQTSDLTSAKGAMESAHMTQGAVRTYLKSTSDLEFSILELQLDPSMAAKSTGDFLRIVKTSEMFRAGPAVPGHANAQCVLPATLPGDKLDEMMCLATVGDTFVIAQAAGTVPMDQKSVTALFANQIDLLKNGPAK